MQQVFNDVTDLVIPTFCRKVRTLAMAGSVSPTCDESVSWATLRHVSRNGGRGGGSIPVNPDLSGGRRAARPISHMLGDSGASPQIVCNHRGFLACGALSMEYIK